ncbi:hypothetical protein [Clostridium manihotivorum]|uniref:SbsA Ig-like domain-containing protein n=1 Tax=Clostridium manihotivorum TaxID=2320868 RepID=A0A3R5QTX9_9CLOT|nr:hypothetical protein [Clostridium manihotivorum]QAA32537.1 hypothetical protein C1I91_13345 [Clostridium manihotivorum]
MKRIINCFLILLTLILSVGPIQCEAIDWQSEDNLTLSPVRRNYADKYPIPILLKSEQVASNKIKITFDRAVDKKLGENPANYCVQDLKNDSPRGIATIGKNETISEQNTLSDNFVKIQATNRANSQFTLTFKNPIPKKEQYKIMIYNISVKDALPYRGDNGAGMFAGK